MSINGSSTNGTILIDLMEEAVYIISIVATSLHFYSDSVMVDTIELGKNRTSPFNDVLLLPSLLLPVPLPNDPVVDIVTTVDSITITWTTSPTVTSAVVSWKVSGGSTARAVHHTNSGNSGLLILSNTYTITELMSGTKYDITVTVINAAGNKSTSFTLSTVEGNSYSR